MVGRVANGFVGTIETLVLLSFLEDFPTSAIQLS